VDREGEAGEKRNKTQQSATKEDKKGGFAGENAREKEGF
jgi:hypothetical protein